MGSIILRFLVVLSVCFGLTGPVWAASPIADVLCAPRDKMTQMLRQQFQSQKMGAGIRDPESMMELWVDTKSEDWTLVMSYADGRACIVAMGESWMDLAPMAQKDPA